MNSTTDESDHFNLASAASDTVASRFERQATATPDNLAIVTDSQTYTYKQLLCLTDRIAVALRELSSSRTRPVILLIDGAPLLLASMLAVAKAARIFVPLDLTPPKAWLSRVVADSDAAHILADRATLTMAQEIAGPNASVVDIEALLEHVEPPIACAEVAANSVCCILYTSGSTGGPKGVALTHRGLLHRAGTRSDRSGTEPGEHIAHLRSGSFIAGKTNVFATLLSGACVYPFEIQKYGLHGFAEWLNERRITSFNITGSLFRAWLATLDENSRLPHLRTVACGSEPLYGGDIARIARCLTGNWKVVHSCGATEVGAFASASFGPASPLEPGILPVGRIVRGYDVWLENESGKVVGSGEAGEIVIRAPYLALGYWNKPELTAAAFRTDVADGVRVYRTSDLGRWRVDGQLEHLGRKDRKIKLRGHSIELYEIEFALLQLPGLTDAILVVDAADPNDKRLIAYVAQSANWASRNGEVLRAELALQLSAHMVPAEIIVLASMPLTRRGKIDLSKLPPLPKPGETRKVDLRAPAGGIERDLARIWEKVLRIPKIGADSNFYDLGGTSLQAFHIFAMIARELGHDIPPTAMIGASTIAKLATLIRNRDLAGATSKSVMVRAQGRNRPLFIMHAVFGDVQYARELARYLKSDRPIYALQPPPLDGSQPIPRSMEAMATAYIGEIRRVQPKGPYLLAGYSFGGWIAFEIAQQLTRRGEAVSFLGLIDTHGKSAPTEREPGPRAVRHARALCQRNIGEIVDYIKGRATKNLSYRFALVRLWAMPYLSDRLRTWLIRPPPYAIRPDLYGRISRRAGRRYRAQPYSGPIVVFGGKGRTEVLKANWQELAQGGLTVTETPADHSSIVRPPYSEILAGHIDAHLHTCSLSTDRCNDANLRLTTDDKNAATTLMA